MMAMQTANDNANDLIQELTLQYNKTRQQAITNELLDIMGDSNNVRLSAKNTKLRRITSTELLTLITIEQYSNNK